MGFLGIGKKKDVVDLGERYRKQKEKLAQMKEDARETQIPATQTQENSSGMFNFFGNIGSNNSIQKTEETETVNPEEKRRKLAKRLMDMTNKIEELTNQIYQLQQRIEVLERKNDVERY